MPGLTLMKTELERRSFLADKCLELSRVALDQGDYEEFRRLLRNSYRLNLANLAALRLESPKAFEQQAELVNDFLLNGLECGGRDLIVEYGFESQILLLED